jgi:hypothetical protein
LLGAFTHWTTLPAHFYDLFIYLFSMR